MRIVITAVGPDNRGLADPIIHHVASRDANIAEIQMYDHDEEKVFAMLVRCESDEPLGELKVAMTEIGRVKGLDVRVWSPDERQRPHLAICVTSRSEPPRAVLEAIRTGAVRAEPTVMIGNRPDLANLAREYRVPFEVVGNASGDPDNELLMQTCDRYGVDYVVLARYMRILPPSSCWKYAGGRIINLHHGLLPGFPGLRPYHDAYASRMLTYGATCHFIIPELDAGNQIINQRTFNVPPGTSLPEIIRQGQRECEPACLVEGLRRVVDREIELHFHRVVARRSGSAPPPSNPLTW